MYVVTSLQFVIVTRRGEVVLGRRSQDRVALSFSINRHCMQAPSLRRYRGPCSKALELDSRTVVQPCIWFLHDGAGLALCCLAQLGSSWNHIQGWMTVSRSYSRALEQRPLSVGRVSSLGPPPPNNGPNSGRRSEKEKRSGRMQKALSHHGTDTTGSFDILNQVQEEYVS